MKCTNPGCLTPDTQVPVLFLCDRANHEGVCGTCRKPTACAAGEHGPGCETRVFEDIKPEVTSDMKDFSTRMRPDGSRFQ